MNTATDATFLEKQKQTNKQKKSTAFKMYGSLWQFYFLLHCSIMHHICSSVLCPYQIIK